MLHPCPFGGEVPKLTCLSGTLIGLEKLDGIRCPGISNAHQHGKSIGRKSDGTFHTRRLQTYPIGLCVAIAELIVNTLKIMAEKNSGPAGALCNAMDVPAPRVPAWSAWEEQRGVGVVLLNEASVRRQSAVINAKQSAVYVHVDDTVIISEASEGPLFCDNILDDIVRNLESVGFGVSQQERHGQASKVVGYEVRESPATFLLPVKKMVLLAEALKFVAGCREVQVRVLRALVGVWIFGALLRRELLSIPHTIFHFMEVNEGGTAKWWRSAREEALAMARVTCLMSCHVGAPMMNWLFATDAMGMNEYDNGGFGIVTTQVTDSELKTLPGKVKRKGDR